MMMMILSAVFDYFQSLKDRCVISRASKYRQPKIESMLKRLQNDTQMLFYRGLQLALGVRQTWLGGGGGAARS
jgi:hypothetical protein